MTNELREKGNRLLSDGCALIDVSGRTREIKEKSVLGLASRKINFSIIIYSKEKKKIFKKLEINYGKKRTPAIIHSVKLYYALKDHIATCPSFYICCDGSNEGLLKYYLKGLLGSDYHEKKINLIRSLVPLFGKKNIADRLAWNVNKKRKKPTIILNEKHFRKLGFIA